MGVRTRVAVLASLLAAAPASRAQQHGYTPQDLESGGQLYQANCAGCHGPEGDGIPGVDFSTGRLRRAASDEEMVRIVLGGIPGTAMPAGSYSEGQAGTIVSYLRSLAASPARATMIPGDAARGRAIFEGAGQCLACHSVAGNGSAVGPVLTDIGSVRRTVQLEAALVDPDAELRSDNRHVEAILRDGTTLTGRLLNQDSFTLQLLDAGQRLRSIDKSALREYTVLRRSTMPSYRGKLSQQELADLVGYLASLRGPQ